MGKPSTFLVLGLSFVLVFLPLHAQTAQAPAANAAAATPAPASQAPEEMTKKITELVHAGKYTEAQKLTAGLLVAYPNDQRLVKANAVIEKLLAPTSSTTSGPTNHPVEPATGTHAEILTGMDGVDYNALIDMVRQAQQNTDLQQQQASLRQFMDESKAFLQKYPGQMLLWQIRGASALSLQDPGAGYEAGQVLLAGGAADSDDPKLQQLLAQLKNKGWLDKQKVADYKSNRWFLGTWVSSLSYDGKTYNDFPPIVFSESASGGIESYGSQGDGKYGNLLFRGTMQGPGIFWEVYLFPTIAGIQHYPSEWQPVIAFEASNNGRQIKILVPSQWATLRDSQNGSLKQPKILCFNKTQRFAKPLKSTAPDGAHGLLIRSEYEEIVLHCKIVSCAHLSLATPRANGRQRARAECSSQSRAQRPGTRRRDQEDHRTGARRKIRRRTTVDGGAANHASQ